MSTYGPGHDSYIDYAAAQPEDHPEGRGFSHGQDIQQEIHHQDPHGQGLNDPHLRSHQLPQQPQPHQVYGGMTHHQPPPFSSGQGMIYGSSSQMPPPSGGGMGHPSGTNKRQRDEMGEMGMEMTGHPSMRAVDMPTMSQHMGPSMGGISAGYGPIQTYHSHALPHSGGRPTKVRLHERDDDSMAGPSGSAPSMLGMEGMPLPAQKPRGPKLKFTPEDDGLLIDLKENKSLTWKQIAEFFPGRSSGTLQVRYCTKLKAKTTQWTDETVQKLRTALHDYEQEKWRIVSQKVGTGFTAAACKEKAAEL